MAKRDRETKKFIDRAADLGIGVADHWTLDDVLGLVEGREGALAELRHDIRRHLVGERVRL